MTLEDIYQNALNKTEEKQALDRKYGKDVEVEDGVWHYPPKIWKE